MFALPACAPRTGTTTLPAEVPDAFSQTGELELPGKWWTALGDTALNRVMDTALTENFNLVVGWERLQAARAVVDRESAALWPDLRANMQAGASFPQPDFVGGENVRLNLQSQYEVDLWGRIHALVDAERFRREASLADYQAGAMTLSAEVARTWFQLAETRGQQAILQAQVETNEQILRLIRQRLGIGQVRGVDVLRQEHCSQPPKSNLHMCGRIYRPLETGYLYCWGRRLERLYQLCLTRYSIHPIFQKPDCRWSWSVAGRICSGPSFRSRQRTGNWQRQSATNTQGFP